MVVLLGVPAAIRLHGPEMGPFLQTGVVLLFAPSNRMPGRRGATATVGSTRLI
jgi:hypothetical protein